MRGQEERMKQEATYQMRGWGRDGENRWEYGEGWV